MEPELQVKLVELNLSESFRHAAKNFQETTHAMRYAQLEETTHAMRYAQLEEAALALQHWRSLSSEGKEVCADELFSKVGAGKWVEHMAETPKALLRKPINPGPGSKK